MNQVTLPTHVPQSEKTEKDYEVKFLPMSEVYADTDFNCRGEILAMDVIDLARDIKKDGLQTPIMVQPWTQVPGKKYRVVAGYRRFTAFIINKESHIPALVKPDLSDLDARRLNLKENLIRQDLNLMQEAKGIATFVAVGYTEAEIAKEFEQSRGWVQIRKAALRLPPDIQKEIAVGILTGEHVRRIDKLATNEEKYALVKQIKEHRDRGERIKIKPDERKIAPGDRKHRNPTEIYKMNEYLLGLFKEGVFGTRCLAWAAGAISDIEFCRDIKLFCEENGHDFVPPDNVREII